MKIIFTEIFVLLSLFLLTDKLVHTDVYTVDTNLSSLEWTAEKINGMHQGNINILNGDIKNNHGHFSGTFEIDMQSIVCQDLKPGALKTKLETFLKSSNFFNVELFPKSKFIINSITPLKDANLEKTTHHVKGLLTIKDKTNEIKFDATIKMEANKFTCIGSATIDRTKYDIKYRSKSYFPDIGDKMIYDEFILKFKVVAEK